MDKWYFKRVLKFNCKTKKSNLQVTYTINAQKIPECVKTKQLLQEKVECTKKIYF